MNAIICPNSKLPTVAASAMEDVQVNPQMAISAATSLPSLTSLQSPSSSSLSPAKLNRSLRFALVLQTCDPSDDTSALADISHPISTCSVTALVVLDDNTVSSTPHRARQWLRNSGLTYYQNIQLFFGMDGLHSLLNEVNIVDAVFVMAQSSFRLQHECVMAALRAYKHVLIYDRTSTPLHDFNEQFQQARQVRRFLQSCTMFVHHYRVNCFMNCVLYEKFGHIKTIDAKLIVHYDDAPKVGVQDTNLPPDLLVDACLRRLARYCVLMSVLLLSRAGSTPVAAHVQTIDENAKNPSNLSVTGQVFFTGQRQLTFEVGFTSTAPTRQILNVQSHDRYATMTDFVLPHRDGLANYRIYDKEFNPTTKRLEVVRGEALDVLSGPPQTAMMWRTFCQLSHVVAAEGYDAPAAAAALELATLAQSTKRIMMALLKSAATRQLENIQDSDDEMEVSR